MRAVSVVEGATSWFQEQIVTRSGFGFCRQDPNTISVLVSFVVTLIDTHPGLVSFVDVPCGAQLLTAYSEPNETTAKHSAG